MEKEQGIDWGTIKLLLQCEVNKQAGLNPVALRETEKKYLGKNGKPEERRWCSQYIPVIALIDRFYKGNLKDKTIVEIGSGEEGKDILAYFHSLGANVIAVDQKYSKNEIKEDVKIIEGRWENLSSILESNSADVIFTHHMHPNPSVGGKFEKSYGSNEFAECIVKEMDKVLKESGVLICHQCSYDYSMPDPSYFGFAYTSAHFKSPDWYNEIFHKKDVDERVKEAMAEYENEPAIGDRLSIYQKNK